MKKIYPYRFLLLRRFFQISIIILFILGNTSIIHFANTSHILLSGDISSFASDGKNLAVSNTKTHLFDQPLLLGNLSASKALGFIPLTDPLAFLQILLSGGALSLDLILGVLIIALIYGVFFGRGYCAFVCPMNLITDLANFLRRIFGVKNTRFLALPRNTRYAILVLSLMLSLLLGVLAWEVISPISMLYRSLIFGIGSGIFGVLIVFLFDLFVMKNGFCGHLCPLGATYGLIGKKSLIKVKHQVDRCTKCMRCVKICPENQILGIIGKTSGVIDDSACIKCGRCIEVCNDSALDFNIFKLLQKENK